ncbi:MAG: arginine--tRNA ligase [Lentisphaeraceae bacterium]|nr:arginine--tRNA ligase [Lentisphaeraceae bacterium]
MQSITDTLKAKVELALLKLISEEDLPDQLVVPSQNPKFADYQCNVAMGLARTLKKAPRQIAEDLVANLDVSDICEPVEIAGPGFINFKIKEEFLKEVLSGMAIDGRLGLEKSEDPEKILVDFSSPNLAKEMHVGHLRSTIIGDSIARFLEFDGHEVLRMNHVGDWGTQFGMLIQYIREEMPDALDNPENFKISSLEEFYRASKKKFDGSEEFANASRKAVVDLQAGDEKTLAVWKVFCEASMEHCHEIYELMDIKIEDRGESAYNDLLPVVVDDLKKAGHAVQTQGAWGVFLDGYKNEDDEPLPTIVQKSDGGYIYATTDLAAIKYRMLEQKVDRAIYVTDARQKGHFEQVFKVSELMNWSKPGDLQHIGFGMMLGKDGKPFKTRDGGTIKLKDLLVEAEERAYKLAKELSSDFTEEELQAIGKTAGHGGVKYSDLSHSIGTDYKFDWDKMLATDGNTAIYILMTYARTRGLSLKAGVEVNDMLGKAKLILDDPQEQKLAKKIASLLDVWPSVTRELTPNLLLSYLFEIAKDFSSFWNACPILKPEITQETKESRMLLAALVGRVIEWGLSMIGIKVLEKV